MQNGAVAQRDAVGNPAPGLCPVSAASAVVVCARTASSALCPNDGESVLQGDCRVLGTPS